MAVIAAFQALAWLSVALRLSVRYLLIKRQLWWDDGGFPCHCARNLPATDYHSPHRRRNDSGDGARGAADLQ